MRDLAGGCGMRGKKVIHKGLGIMNLAGWYWQHGCISPRSSENSEKWLFYGNRMSWTPNKVTLLRVLVGFAAGSLVGRGALANLAAVGVRVVEVALGRVGGALAL